MTRSFSTGLIFAVVAMVLGLYSCAQAQTWRIPVPMTSTERLPPAPPVKLCPEERITTIAQSRAADQKVCR